VGEKIWERAIYICMCTCVCEFAACLSAHPKLRVWERERIWACVCSIRMHVRACWCLYLCLCRFGSCNCVFFSTCMFWLMVLLTLQKKLSSSCAESSVHSNLFRFAVIYFLSLYIYISTHMSIYIYTESINVSICIYSHTHICTYTDIHVMCVTAWLHCLVFFFLNFSWMMLTKIERFQSRHSIFPCVSRCQ